MDNAMTDVQQSVLTATTKLNEGVVNLDTGGGGAVRRDRSEAEPAGEVSLHPDAL